MVKNDRIPLENYYSKNCSEELFRKFFNGYQEKLQKERLLDFDDMLVMCYELLYPAAGYPGRLAEAVPLYSD